MKSNFIFRYFALFVICIAFLNSNAQSSQDEQFEQDFTLLNSTGVIYNELIIKHTITNTQNKSDLNNSSVEIYPSPATEYIFIKSAFEDYSDCKFTIFTADGKRISDGNLSNSLYKVEFKDLSPGNYLISLTNENGNLHKPLNFSIVK